MACVPLNPNGSGSSLTTPHLLLPDETIDGIAIDGTWNFGKDVVLPLTSPSTILCADWRQPATVSSMRVRRKISALQA